ncbi:MAG: hypothetical protein ACQCN4_11515 [Candidatus Bathyarchaeia archaeon]|jgi:hypothetical protein
MSSPVACQVIVHGGGDPTDKYQSMFLIELKPKGYVFPEQAEDGAHFEMGNGASSVQELREYLKNAVDFFDARQSWCYMLDEELDKYVRVLPAPFNDPDAIVDLTWSQQDVSFDAAAQLLLDFHDKAFSELELRKLDAEELNIILAAKGGSKVGHRKADLIDAILEDQKAKGLSAVRVKQTSLQEAFA